MNKLAEYRKNSTIKSLKSAYEENPIRPLPPRKMFIRDLAKHCEVSESTVRKWISGSSLPSKKQYVERICEFTGIPEDHLWPGRVLEFND